MKPGISWKGIFTGLMISAMLWGGLFLAWKGLS